MEEMPRMRVYDPQGKFRAVSRDYAAIAVLLDFYGPGSTARTAHRRQDIFFTEGEDGNAGDNYDAVAAAFHERKNDELR